jgi:flagellar basal-body rod protein FlgC
MFTAMNTAGSGLSAYQTFLDTTAYNIANVNTARRTDQAAFSGQYVQLQEVTGSPTSAVSSQVGRGVSVTSLQTGDPAGRIVYAPDNPLADAQGEVRMPDIDLSDQMSNLIIAQRAFQANATTVDRAKDVYQAAIAIGKGV